MMKLTDEQKKMLKSKLVRSENTHIEGYIAKSLLNIMNLTTSNNYIENDIESSSPGLSENTNKFTISTIIKGKHFSNFSLMNYNLLKDQRKIISLQGVVSGNDICRNHAFAKKSGYYFIYDNEGKINVIYNELQICELNLPDKRIDPSFFIFERNKDQTILLAAGGFLKFENYKNPLDTIAVYYLDFKNVAALKNLPLYYIRMKYKRFNPLIFKYQEQENLENTYLIIIGGNSYKKIKETNFIDNEEHEKIFEQANCLCETIKLSTIKEILLKQEHNDNPVIITEDCMYLMIDGNLKTDNKIKYNLSEAAIVPMMKKNGKKLCYLIFGIGESKKEIWYLDLFDFIEHKIFMYKSQYELRNTNKLNFICNSNVTLFKDHIFYFKDSDDIKNSLVKLEIKNCIFTKKTNAKCWIPNCLIF